MRRLVVAALALRIAPTISRPGVASIAVAALLTTLVWSPNAHAFHWMIRHGYTGCATCHTDPSGAGILEPYGTVIADQLVRTRYPGEDVEDNLGAFALGTVPLPESLRLQADVRALWLASKVEGTATDSRFIWMQSDLSGALRLGDLVMSASVGYADQGATLAAITRGSKENLVSRQHWIGLWDDGGKVLVRAGRMNLPFGVRAIEHTLWVRQITRTNIDDQQQDGVSVFAGGDWLRGELMAVAGNYQVRPDEFRERGYSGYVEWAVVPSLTLGGSSLITHRELDPVTAEKTWRHAHGGFARWVMPFSPLVLTSELDYVLVSSRHYAHQAGIAGYAQADLELVQGLHLLATGETENVGPSGQPASYAGWISYAWFFLPHADLRLDSIYYSLRNPSGTTNSLYLLAQLHAYL